MSGRFSPPREIPPVLGPLVEDCCNGTISEEKNEELNTLLRGNTSHQAFYLAYLSIHSQLCLEHGVIENPDGADQKTLSPEMEFGADQKIAPSKWAAGADQNNPRRSKRWRHWAAVAVAVLLAVGIYGVQWSQTLVADAV